MLIQWTYSHFFKDIIKYYNYIQFLFRKKIFKYEYNIIYLTKRSFIVSVFVCIIFMYNSRKL